MSSSISSSDAWRRTARGFLGGLALGLGVLFGFVALVDPWGVLPLSLPLDRKPISGNARFTYPALARSARFDAAILGTSTLRQVQPAELDRLTGARFVNLSMNSATPFEQTELLRLFLRAHPAPAAVVIGLDHVWCAPTDERLTPRPFPAWMYDDDPWDGYRHMLTPYAVQEAGSQLWAVLGLKRGTFGADGYAPFLPPESQYDPARVTAAFARMNDVDRGAAAPGDAIPLPALGRLDAALASIPRATRVVIVEPPLHAQVRGAPGTRAAARWAACTDEVRRMAAARGAVLLNLNEAGPVTDDRANYWDPLHFRAPVARWVERRLAAALDSGGAEDEHPR
jgi:hypothetical protein